MNPTRPTRASGDFGSDFRRNESRHLTRRGLLTAGSLAVAALTGCSSLTQGAVGSGTVRLDLAHVGDLASPQQRIAEMLRDAIEEQSADIELVIHDSGTLGDEAELQGAAVDGTIDLVIAGSFSHFAPWAGILETPMLFPTTDDFRTFAQGPVGDGVIERLSSELGTVPLFIAPHEGPRAITTAKTPVVHPDDLRGLKIRDPEVPSFTVLANQVGAIPIALDFGELYLALDRGVVDGQHNPLGNIVSQSFQEVQGYLSMVPWGISPHVVTVSRYTWDRLDSSHKEVLRAAAETVAEDYYAVAQRETEELLDELKGEIEIILLEDIDLPAFEAALNDAIPALERRYDDSAVAMLDEIRSAR